MNDLWLTDEDIHGIDAEYEEKEDLREENKNLKRKIKYLREEIESDTDVNKDELLEILDEEI